MMKNFLAYSALALFVWLFWPSAAAETIDVPLLAAQTPPVSADVSLAALDLPWLHVVVETKYAWIYQKSVGKAWVTKSRDDTTRVNVGELCIQLDCYAQHKACESDTSYIEIQEIKRRVAVKKKLATVSAWANNPALEKVTVEMMP